MSFDILNFHIADNSPEAKAVERVMIERHVSPEEAIRSILRNSGGTKGSGNVILEGKGMFSSSEDARILDEAVAIALEDRRRPSTQALD